MKHISPTILTNNLSKINFHLKSFSFILELSHSATQIDFNTTWKHKGITVAGGNGRGDKLNQLSLPEGVFIDDDQNIYIADYWNHRIVEWKCNGKNGKIVAGGNGEGNKMNQLNLPTDVIMDIENNSLIIADKGNRRIMRWSLEKNTKNGQIIISDIDCWGLTIDKDGFLYISDCVKNEVRRWKREDQNGAIVAGGNGKGDQLNQLNSPSNIFLDEDDSLYVSDRDNHRVMKWLKNAKEGIVVAGGNGKENSLTQLSYPRGVIVDQLDQIYVADGGNDRVMRWCRGAKEGTIVVGENGRGTQSNQFYRPKGLSFDRQGNLYVADYENHRIQKFEIN
jgi:sugar lactone lactonase YvrE